MNFYNCQISLREVLITNNCAFLIRIKGTAFTFSERESFYPLKRDEWVCFSARAVGLVCYHEITGGMWHEEPKLSERSRGGDKQKRGS